MQRTDAIKTRRLKKADFEEDFLFILYFVEGWIVELELTAIQFRAEPGIILTRRFEEAASLRLTRGIQLDLGDRAKRCLSEDPGRSLFSRAESKLKRRMT